MTLAKVAQKANVAIATASKVFNKDQSVRSYLRERVLQAAADLDYKPSMMARGLRKKQTNIVTVGIKELDNPYFGALSHAVISALNQKGYVGIVCIDHAQIKDINVASCSCGTILAQALSSRLRDMAQAGPIVTINNRDPRPDLASDIHIDFIEAYQTIINDLKQQGVRHVAYGCPVTDMHWEVDYQQKFTSVHEAFRLSPHSKPVVGHTPEQVLKLLQNDTQIDAVFCVNDPFAADLVTLLHMQAASLGRDVKVVGCDGNRKLWDNWTIDLDVRQIGQMAVDLLHERLQGEEHVVERTYHAHARKS